MGFVRYCTSSTAEEAKSTGTHGVGRCHANIFAWGDVDIFMADGRYERSPDKAPDDEQKTMLGDAPFAWLVEGLRKSSARFELIVSGSPLDHSLHDGWRIYTHARRQFFDAIREHRIPGVVYLSGSLHNSLAWEHHESDRVGYPLVEVISSGIANSKKLSYATLDFDTKAADPTMTVRIVRKADFPFIRVCRQVVDGHDSGVGLEVLLGVPTSH